MVPIGRGYSWGSPVSFFVSPFIRQPWEYFQHSYFSLLWVDQVLFVRGYGCLSQKSGS